MSARARSIAWLAIVAMLVAACAPAPGVGGPGAAQSPAAAQSPMAGTPRPVPAAEKEKPLDFVWFTDGPDLEVIKDLVGQFERREGVKVEFLVLPFAQLTQRLQAQIASGNVPDVVRVTDTAPIRRHLLDVNPYLGDAKAFRGQFVQAALGPVTGPKGETYGIPHDFTMNGPFVNLDLFTAAGIKVPGAKDKPWTWDELVTNATAAQRAGNARYAMAFDRSGHRFGGMLSQYGGRFFDEQGAVDFGGDGAKRAVQQFIDLHKRGAIPADVWVGSGGQYAAATEFFVSGQTAVYFSGNWQVAQFSRSITRFKWAAMPNPCAANCGGYPGGKFVVAMAGSDQPTLASRLVAFLGSRQAMEEYARRAQFLPTRNDLIKDGIKYADRVDDMAAYLADLARLPEQTFKDLYHPVFGPVANVVRDQITRALVGELNADQVIAEVKRRAKPIVDEARR